MYEWIEAGLDYLSCTLPVAAPSADMWAFRCQKAIEDIAMDGHELQERSMNGYRGLSAGNCFIGSREDSYFLNLTGGYADSHFEAVWRADLHCSRIDLQLTAKTLVTRADIAQGAYRDATTHNDTLPPQKRRKLYVIVGSDGGDTLYVGAPSSEQRGRIYNKAIQSGLPRYMGCWRWEVVLRNELATEYIRALRSASMSRDEYVLASVCKWYAERGVQTAVLCASSNVVLPRQRATRTDVERKLEWLEHQVRPTIAFLCELGFRDTIIELMGLGAT